MNHISAVIITKNEEKNIKDCLKSLDFVEEIIVVDTESSDKTVKVAKRFTEKVYLRTLDNYANQKNFGISKAKNEWILSVDADERVSDKLKKEILSKNLNKDGYFIPIKNYFLGRWLKYGGQYPDYHLRLFKKSKGRFYSKIKQVHEGVSLNSRNAGKLNCSILHYSYPNISFYFEKFNRYTYLDALGRFQNHLKPSIYGVFIRPIYRFIKWYILKLGALDGISGLLFHIFSAFYIFASEIKLLELYKFNLKVLKWRS
ncbi:MAG: glycosyltransferase family 2 protein [Candidatus Firestonebacteria bacterium]